MTKYLFEDEDKDGATIVGRVTDKQVAGEGVLVTMELLAAPSGLPFTVPPKWTALFPADICDAVIGEGVFMKIKSMFIFGRLDKQRYPPAPHRQG